MTNFELIKQIVKEISVDQLAEKMCEYFDCKSCPVSKVDNLFYEIYCPTKRGQQGKDLLVEYLKREVNK